MHSLKQFWRVFGKQFFGVGFGSAVVELCGGFVFRTTTYIISICPLDLVVLIAAARVILVPFRCARQSLDCVVPLLADLAGAGPGRLNSEYPQQLICI